MRKFRRLVAGVAMTFCLLVFCTAAFAQKPYSGKVLSENDQTPVSGVSITIKGKQTGTASAVDGSFVISANPGDVLVFTGADIKAYELKLSDNTSLVVSVQQEIKG